MKWRYHLVVFSMSCFFSWELFNSQACQGTINLADLIIGALGLIGIFGIVGRWIWGHTVYKTGNISFTRISSLPTDKHKADDVHDFEDKILTISPGLQEINFRVRSSYGFQVKKINWRFVDLDGNDLTTDKAQILSVQDRYNPSMLDDNDGHYGRDGYYPDAQGLANGECLYFILTIDGNDGFIGKLSCRVQNHDGFRSIQRRRFEIRSS